MCSTFAHPLDLLATDVAALHALNALPGCRLSSAQPRLTTDDKNNYSVAIDAPGVAPSDLNIEVLDGKLSVTGKTSTQAATHFCNVQVALPHNADAASASASAADGLVLVTMPKKAPVEVVPTRVAVSSASNDCESDDDDDDERYKVTVIAAGIAPTELDVLAKPGLLKVEGASARTGAKVAKCFKLPRDADVVCATATHVNGILTVTVPKQPPLAKQLRVQVQTSSAAVVDSVDREGMVV